MHDLALITAARGDYPAAESMFRQVLETHRKAMGDKHPILATTLNNLSRVLLEQKRTDEAAAALQDALDIARAALGSDHQLVAIYTINLASLHLTRKQPAAAEALLREALRIRVLSPELVASRRRTFLEDDWSVGATKACSAPRSLPSRVTTKPKRYCSMRAMISTRCHVPMGVNSRPPWPD